MATRDATGEGSPPGVEDAGAAKAVRVLDAEGRVAPEPRVHYLVHDFELSHAARSLTATLRYRKERLCQLFLSLFGPGGDYRGTRMDPAAYGDVVLKLRVAEKDAGPGGLAGPLPPGRYRAMIDVERTEETSDYRLEVVADYYEPLGDGPATAAKTRPSDGEAAPRGAGWYRGELHSHTGHSDGRAGVEDLVEAARAAGLDFLALTDHFTGSGWGELRGSRGRTLRCCAARS